LLFFLAYAPLGAVVPLFTLHLTELGFTPTEIGWICATQAIGALIAPLLVGQIADRWIAADRCLAWCALLTAGLLWLLAEQVGVWPVFVVCLVFWITVTPLMTLANAIGFTHLPQGHFGWVRLGGTFGWMVQCWLVGYWFQHPDWLAPVREAIRAECSPSLWSDAFRLASLMALVVSVYALTLPRTLPCPARTSSFFAPLAALQLIRRRPFAVYFLCTVGLCVTMPFTTQNNPLLLKELGITNSSVTPILTLCQSTELISLGFLPVFLPRFGQRRTMIFGLSCWLVGLSILTIGGPVELVVPSLVTHGLYICCYLVAGQVFVNSQARGDLRVSAQGLITFASGLVLLLGNLLVGLVREHFHTTLAGTYGVAVVLTLCLWVVFLAGFSEEHPAPTTNEEDSPLREAVKPQRLGVSPVLSAAREQGPV